MHKLILHSLKLCWVLRCNISSYNLDFKRNFRTNRHRSHRKRLHNEIVIYNAITVLGKSNENEPLKCWSHLSSFIIYSQRRTNTRIRHQIKCRIWNVPYKPRFFLLEFVSHKYYATWHKLWDIFVKKDYVSRIWNESKAMQVLHNKFKRNALNRVTFSQRDTKRVYTPPLKAP